MEIRHSTIHGELMFWDDVSSIMKRDDTTTELYLDRLEEMVRLVPDSGEPTPQLFDDLITVSGKSRETWMELARGCDLHGCLMGYMKAAMGFYIEEMIPRGELNRALEECSDPAERQRLQAEFDAQSSKRTDAKAEELTKLALTIADSEAKGA